MKNMFKLFLLPVLFSFCFVLSAYGQEASIVGKWKTIDDDTNEPKSIVQIYEKDGKFFGKIIKLFRKPGEDPDPKCTSCDKNDPRHNQPIIGMEIVQNLKKSGDEYTHGTILDPAEDSGDTYTCKMWLEDGNLMVRGYIAFFFRTQTWHRVEE